MLRDLGLAARDHEPGEGPAAYQAPEQRRGGNGRSGSHTDIYQLAAIAYHLVAGHPPLCVANIDSLMSQVSSGKLKPIASTGAQRSPVTPDTPTFAEAGYPDLVVTSW